MDTEGFTGMLFGVVWSGCCLILVIYLDFPNAFVLLLGCKVAGVSRQATSKAGFRTESLIFLFFSFFFFLSEMGLVRLGTCILLNVN